MNHGHATAQHTRRRNKHNAVLCVVCFEFSSDNKKKKHSFTLQVSFYASSVASALALASRQFSPRFSRRLTNSIVCVNFPSSINSVPVRECYPTKLASLHASQLFLPTHERTPTHTIPTHSAPHRTAPHRSYSMCVDLMDLGAGSELCRADCVRSNQPL